MKLSFPIKKLVKSLLFLSLLHIAPTILAATFVAADHTNMAYTGRVDFSKEKQAYLSWPGTSIHFRFSGDKLILKLADDKGLNYYNVIFNQQDSYPYVLSAKKGLHQYDLSHMITGSETEVTIFKRTEGAEGGSYFHGLQLAQDGELLTPPAGKKMRIAFFGDSVTVGMGNEAAHNSADDKPEEKNHYLSYAAITARNLNAEFHSIAKSGIGFMVSWFDFIMPEYYDQLTAEDNNDSQWDFNQWTPDVVVVNLGQNDSWLIDDKKKLQATNDEIIAAYQDFVTTLLTKYPQAYFICALGSMDATADDKWPGYIEIAVDNIKQHANSQGKRVNIDTLMFEFTGYGSHPRVDQHQKNAAKLTELIRDKLNEQQKPF